MNMKEKVELIRTIFIDIDGVIINFLKQYCKFHLNKTGKLINWLEIDNYDLNKIFETEKIEKYKYLKDEKFYDDIEFMSNSIEMINLLNLSHKIYFSIICVTYESLKAKFKLLEKTFKFFNVENFIVLNRKEYLLVENEILIDDSPYTLELSKMSIKICFNWKYNEKIKNVNFRSSDWRKIYMYIQQIVYWIIFNCIYI